MQVSGNPFLQEMQSLRGEISPNLRSPIQPDMTQKVGNTSGADFGSYFLKPLEVLLLYKKIPPT